MGKKVIEKEAIIAEYLTGEISYRKLGEKYGIDFRLIHSWVSKYQGKPMKKRSKKDLQVQSQEEAPATARILSCGKKKPV